MKIVGQPGAVRFAGSNLFLDFGVVDDTAFFRVDQEHAAGFEAAFHGDIGRVDFQHPGFRGHDDEAVLGHGVAGGAQAVAVQQGADTLAVGKRDGRRAVPRLHEGRVVFVKRLLLIAHGVVVLPRFGHEHHHGMRQGPAGVVEQFHRVVERGRVAGAGGDDREDLVHVVAKQRRLEQYLAGVHEIGVAAHGVDFSVVAEKTKRMREVPRREGVGAVPLMHQGQTAHDVRVGEVGQEGFDLVGQHQSLVHEGLAGEAAGVIKSFLGQIRPPDRVKHLLADHIQFAVEVPVVGDAFAAADEDLGEEGLGGAGNIAQHLVVDRDVAPAKELLAFGAHDVGIHLFAFLALDGIARQED